MRLIAFLFLSVLLVAPVTAQQRFNEALEQMKIEQKLNGQVPFDARFADDKGNEIEFGSIFGKRPVILLPMFFLCKGICGKETDSLLKTIAKMEGKEVGRDYDVVLLSISPRETPELAHNKKTSLLKVMKGSQNEAGYHFLTGTMPEIRKVTEAVGFGFAYDEKDGRINHPAGLMILTPTGKVSQYVMGADYPKPIIEQALTLAGNEKIGKKAETVLLGCVMIDPITGARSIVIENVIRLVAGIFAIGVFAWIGSMIVKGRRQDAAATKGGTPTRA
jgi:protein SCO1/2